MLRLCVRFACCAIAALILHVPSVSAQQAPQLVCWVSSFIYRNDTASNGSVMLELHDQPQVHSYTATYVLTPGQQSTVSIYGLLDSGSVVGSSANSATLTFVGFGAFEQVDNSLCAPKAVPSLGWEGLVLLGGLLIVLAAWGSRRRRGPA